MNGDTRFYANISFIGSMPEKDVYYSIIKDAIDKNIKEIKEHCFCFNDKDETIINDWFNQIYIDAGYHPSITYDYLPVYFEIASQLVEHGLKLQQNKILLLNNRLLILHLDISMSLHYPFQPVSS